MPDKEIFVLKIVWMKSIASLHRLTQAVKRANLRRTAGDPTWVCPNFINLLLSMCLTYFRKNIWQFDLRFFKDFFSTII